MAQTAEKLAEQSGLTRQEVDEYALRSFNGAKNAQQTDTEGFGIGLFLVKTFLDEQGGSISFVSEEERGTTLTLQLIAAPATIFSGKLIFNIILVFCKIRKVYQ